MDIFFTLMVPLEMLLVNLRTLDRCLTKKRSSFFTYGCMALFIVVYISSTFMIISQTPGFGTGNGLFVFFGFLFLFPVMALYRTSVLEVICISCTSWIYTFLLFSLSVQGAYLLLPYSMARSAFYIQTVLYILTLYFFDKAVRERFIHMLRHMSRQNSHFLMWVGILWFFTVFIMNLSFVHSDIPALRPVALLSLALCIYVSYRYIYRLVISSQTIQNLEHIAYYDNLTQLRSRTMLYNDAEGFFSKEIPFHLIFMDLNNFKSINDEFGHAAGDDYLAFFAKEIKTRLGDNGGFYRISGDEFVCIHTTEEIEAFLTSFDTLPSHLPDTEVPFLGFSYGIARHPQDGETLEVLLEVADSRMYDMKKGAKRE